MLHFACFFNLRKTGEKVLISLKPVYPMQLESAVLCYKFLHKTFYMQWILNNSGSNVSDYQMTCDDGNRIVFKYSRSQQTIRMRCNEHYGVFVLDEGSFTSKKISIRNIYGSEIGALTKSLLRESSGYILLDDFPQKNHYIISSGKGIIELANNTTIFIDVTKKQDSNINETYLLSLIVFSWLQSVTADTTVRVT